MGRPKKIVSQKNIENFQKELEEVGERTDLLLQDKRGRSKSCLFCRRRKQRCDHKLPSCTACLKAAVKCVQPVRYSNATNNVSKKDRAKKPNSTNTTDSPYTAFSSQSGTPDLSSIQQLNSSQASSQIDLMNIPISGQTVNKIQPITTHNSAVVETKVVNTEESNNMLLKKIKYLEQLLDLSPTSSQFAERVEKYKQLNSMIGETQNSQNLGSQHQQSLFSSPGPIYANQSSSSQSVDGAFNQNRGMPYRAPIRQSINSPTVQEPEKYRLVRDIPALASDSVDSIDFSNSIFAKYNLKQLYNYDPVFEFDKELSRLFLDTYFTRLQFKYPLLDENEIYTFHHNYVNNKIYSYSETEFHFACGRMWLLFSISACLYMTSGKNKGLPPYRYFSTAIRHISKCDHNLTYLQQVELLTLLVLYILRTDQDSSILYEIIKDVMVICKDKLQLNIFGAEDVHCYKKLRIFWSVYLLERMICISVWRPYSIVESEIKLPYLPNDVFEHNGKTPQKNNNVFFLNQSLMLRRIESEFVEKLKILPHTVTDKKILKEQLPLVKNYFHRLESWRAGCSASHFKNYENETIKLYYYRSVRLLIQPYLEVLKPEDRLFRECQAAAGQICQLYKIFHQKTVYGHSTPAVHIVFVAGVTLIYCMWLTRNLDDKRRKILGDVSKHTRPHLSASLFSTIDDLRACSVCLYSMTERSKFARIFRDTFDQLMNATIGNLIERCGPDSSELIYITSGNNELVIQDGVDQYSKLNMGGSKHDGMPPAVNRVYGKRQGESYGGFVENSQVDRETKHDLKRSRKVLENTSLPNGLSNLLINGTDSDKSDGNLDDNIEKTSEELSNNFTNPGTSSESEKAIINRLFCNAPENVSDDNKKNQYIVKKPNASPEVDWEPYQIQAYLQQHVARQNLQAYLSSLVPNAAASINGTPPKQLNDAQINVKSPPIYDRRSPQQECDRYILNNNAPSSDEYYNQNVRQSVSASTLVNADEITNKTHSNLSVSTAVQTPIESQPLPMINPHNVSNDTLELFSGISNQFGNILLNNGAHDMINNISSWTSDFSSIFTAEQLSEYNLGNEYQNEKTSMYSRKYNATNPNFENANFFNGVGNGMATNKYSNPNPSFVEMKPNKSESSTHSQNNWNNMFGNPFTDGFHTGKENYGSIAQ
ncbi:hypothetical protein TPHA_0K01100 [Tetrapisispora phaffii CBS 4417]|uniref:Zn(2)-C6 fungal-type domain-containing protein n=1 Tax=Tetrapisispora phaffii (strain ATCC 24235 / CBS 4417 / NBRC 1672 / NRRL Y-8282 / UCD 70-5) TaxID=1071381 RepID=G8BZB6_TETPH|nr:hypothetical protein TPHA_0K01100 [Tetrapisispora phaffii CBS 4417]CCE65244.1 hypothetical protein TPHA_0K01100 [Tetrapisispora phaffii CBS 4417]